MKMFEEIAKILSEQLGIPQSKITLESNIIEDLNADSLDVVELLMTLEDNTGKTIPDDMVSDIKTVGDLVEVLKKL
jgi:acyl carrier protein